MKLVKTVYGLMIVMGFTLLGINISGMFLSMRNPAILNEKTGFENDITMSPKQFYDVISTKEGTNLDYITKVTSAVNRSIAHYWDESGIDKYHLRVPIWENFWLYFIYSIFLVDKRYEFCDYHKAIERGVGYCSQEAYILDSVLDEKGIPAKIIEFPWLHVITTAQINPKTDEWWVFDPDYDVIIKEDINTINSNPQIVKNYYLEAGYGEDVANHLVSIFGTKYNLHDTVDYYLSGQCRNERVAYFLIWVLPIFFIAAGSLPFVRKRKENGS